MSLSVIGAGLGRTGTLSLKLALERLGLNRCYHMVEWLDRLEDGIYWQAAIDGGRPDWDRLFDGYRATVDFPACLFYRELSERYPEAKIVLTERSSKRWYRSVRETTYTASREIRAAIEAGRLHHPPGSVQRLKWVDQAIWDGLFGGRFEDESHARSVFEAHNREVRESLPEDKLLVFEVTQGWEPLCEFLDVPVPDEPFPRCNTRGEFIEWMHRRLAGEGNA